MKMEVIFREDEHYITSLIRVGECFRLNNSNVIYMRIFDNDFVNSKSGYIAAVSLTNAIIEIFKADAVVIPVTTKCQAYDYKEGDNNV